MFQYLISLLTNETGSTSNIKITLHLVPHFVQVLYRIAIICNKFVPLVKGFYNQHIIDFSPYFFYGDDESKTFHTITNRSNIR